MRNFRQTLTLVSVLCTLVLAASDVQATTWFVGTNGNDGYDGSFFTPFRTIQHAIDTAASGDAILVFPGVYGESLSWGKNLTIQGNGSVIDPTAGGLTGYPCLVASGGVSSASHIDGFILQNGTGVQYYGYGGGMTNAGVSPVITNCVFRNNTGIAMYNSDGSSPTVINCTFSGNIGSNMSVNSETNGTYDLTASSGGAMYNAGGSSPNIRNCTFTGNLGGYINVNHGPGVSVYQLHAAGGAMYNDANSRPTVVNCTFSRNIAGEFDGYYYTADASGGAIYSFNSNATVIGCVFTGNVGGYFGGGYSSEGYPHNLSRGGGIYNGGGSPSVTNCVFANNNAGTFYNPFGSSYGQGGGMFNSGGSPVVTNCTLAYNFGSSGGGGMLNDSSNPTVANCIVWANSGGGISNFNSNPTVTNSDVQGLSATPANPDANHNFAADPLFLRNPSPGPDGAWVTADDDYGDLRLQGTFSPCVDAGDDAALPPDTADLNNNGNTTEQLPVDANGNTRNVFPRVDMGAYEDQSAGRPVANAGPDQTVRVPHDGNPSTSTAAIILDGSGSYDSDGDTLTYDWNDGQGHTATGVQPMLNLPAGTWTFTLTVTDTHSLYRQDTVTITVLPELNGAPVTNDISVSLNQDTSTSITLAAFDPDDDDLLVFVSSPTHGTLAYGPGLSLVYTPAPGYYGPDSFSYFALDPYGLLSNSSTAIITVAHVNHPPVAANDTATTKKGTAATIAVLANDSDPDGDALTISSFTQPAKGTVVKNANNTMTFNPAKAFVGTTSFSYTISDGHGGTANATVTVTVTK